MPSPRYQGKPLLRILECYVLWAIGALPEDDADALKAMTPKLAACYGGEGSWQEIMAAALELPPTLPEMIRGSWEKSTERARAGGATLDPQAFAEHFVDKNLVE
jgi:hypothetical protein